MWTTRPRRDQRPSRYCGQGDVFGDVLGDVFGATLATGFFAGFFFSARGAGAGCTATTGAGCAATSGSIVLRMQEPPMPRIDTMH